MQVSINRKAFEWNKVCPRLNCPQQNSTSTDLWDTSESKRHHLQWNETAHCVTLLCTRVQGGKSNTRWEISAAVSAEMNAKKWQSGRPKMVAGARREQVGGIQAPGEGTCSTSQSQAGSPLFTQRTASSLCHPLTTDTESVLIPSVVTDWILLCYVYPLTHSWSSLVECKDKNFDG